MTDQTGVWCHWLLVARPDLFFGGDRSFIYGGCPKSCKPSPKWRSVSNRNWTRTGWTWTKLNKRVSVFWIFPNWKSGPVSKGAQRGPNQTGITPTYFQLKKVFSITDILPLFSHGPWMCVNPYVTSSNHNGQETEIDRSFINSVLCGLCLFLMVRWKYCLVE